MSPLVQSLFKCSVCSGNLKHHIDCVCGAQIRNLKKLVNTMFHGHCGDGRWIEPAQYRDQWRTLFVSVMINIQETNRFSTCNFYVLNTQKNLNYIFNILLVFKHSYQKTFCKETVHVNYVRTKRLGLPDFIDQCIFLFAALLTPLHWSMV
jgi:hypothetical protein